MSLDMCFRAVLFRMVPKHGLYRKRQLGYGGLIKTIKKQLALDDAENGDLVHTSDDKENISKGTEIVAIWNATKQNYYLKK